MLRIYPRAAGIEHDHEDEDEHEHDIVQVTLFKCQNARQAAWVQASQQRIANACQSAEQTWLEAIVFSNFGAEPIIYRFKRAPHGLVDHRPAFQGEFFAPENLSNVQKRFGCAPGPAAPMIESHEVWDIWQILFDFSQELRIPGLVPHAGS
jgi:hypothetical protein